jgi:DNA-binding response OmpR family regulator
MEGTEMTQRILVVDDDETLANLLVNLMVTNGYQAEKAFSGSQALQMVHENTPDLILLDIVMPGLNGFDVLTKLRKNPATSDIPVVIVSALSDELSILEGWVRDTDGYISKPFLAEEILKTVELVLAETLEERKQERAERIDQLLEMICKVEENYGVDVWGRISHI